MASTSFGIATTYPRGSAMLAWLAVAHLGLLIALPVFPVIALGVWWNSNTISHNFIHRPFFRNRWANRIFGAYLSLLLGIPQTLWRDRHLAHHAGVRHRLRLSPELLLQVTLVLSLWGTLGYHAPAFFLTTYLPGYLAGLALCWVHGHYEHARGATSHYGRIYNLLFFNDGFHVEHHRDPGMHWTRLPERREPMTNASLWPAPMRWLETFSLESLERLVLRSPLLQRFLLRTHRRALGELLKATGPFGRVAIVGGGMFPRTALILAKLLPDSRLTVLDANQSSLDQARPWLPGPEVEMLHQRYDGSRLDGYDLAVFPLAYEGDRGAIYDDPPAPAVLVHDWIWKPRGASRIVSLMLLKRVNLLRR